MREPKWEPAGWMALPTRGHARGAAAVRHAVAVQAARIIEAETTATRYRLRAIRDRLIPSLQRARAEVALAIDELERADGARLRRVAGKDLGP